MIILPINNKWKCPQSISLVTRWRALKEQRNVVKMARSHLPVDYLWRLTRVGNGGYKFNFSLSKNYVKSITRWGEGLLNSAPFYPQILLKIANCMHQEALRKVLLAALEYILPKMPPKNFVKKMKIKKTMTKMLKKFHRNFNFCNDHFDIIASTPQESSISVLFNLDPIDINPMVKSAPRCLPAQGISNAPNGSRRSTGCWCYGWWSSQCRRRLVRLGLVRNSSSRLKKC